METGERAGVSNGVHGVHGSADHSWAARCHLAAAKTAAAAERCGRGPTFSGLGLASSDGLASAGSRGIMLTLRLFVYLAARGGH